jgi:PadR family transcriptional regulator, regulatory protein PadR
MLSNCHEASLKHLLSLEDHGDLLKQSVGLQYLISKFDNSNSSFDQQQYIYLVLKQQRELFFGLIRIHVLVHASHEPIFGLAMMEELKHHGYRIGPGTLYPLLHGLERGGLLKSVLKNVGGRKRRIYKITPVGKKALDKAKAKVDELHHELHEEPPRKISPFGDNSASI